MTEIYQTPSKDRGPERTVLFVGDYHVYGRFDRFMNANQEHQLFSDELAQLVAGSDLAIFNLEDPITESRSGCLKSGPYGVGSESCLVPVSRAGFNLATFATNHTYDMKDRGIKDTLRHCQVHGIAVTGAGLNRQDARTIHYQSIGDFKVSVLNFARREFNTATSRHGGANPLDVIDNAQDIKTASHNSDYVFVVVHEGVDRYELPYPLLVKQMRFYADMGANAIIVHHSRRISGQEVYKDVPIFYGIGNLLHLSQNSNEHSGLAVRFHLTPKRLEYDTIPIMLDPNKVCVAVCDGRARTNLLKTFQQLSETIQDSSRLEAEWLAHVRKKGAGYVALLVGHPRLLVRVVDKLGISSWYRRLILMRKRRYLSLLNLLRCQAHREILDELLDDIFRDDKP